MTSFFALQSSLRVLSLKIDKYVVDILKKFDFWSIRTATTPIESNKPLVKDEDGVDVDVHVYRSMIGSLMYLTASRLDIMFIVYGYARDSSFELEAFSDSDYGGASLDKKSTTGGCQFLGRRLISWQCKKQMIVTNSTTEAEYVAAAKCCGQLVLPVWLILPSQHLVLPSLVSAAQKHLMMEMMFGLDKMMMPGKFGAARQIWCCEANLVLSGKFGAVRQIWCCQANLVLSGKFGAARQIWCCKGKVCAVCYCYYY
ncbi:hypothetical protein Tco_1177743 [Tanacetum coccineum]